MLGWMKKIIPEINGVEIFLSYSSHRKQLNGMAVLVELFGAAILENAEAVGESGVVVGGGILVTGTDCVEASGALLWASGEVSKLLRHRSL
jgi:hypothetical protein